MKVIYVFLFTALLSALYACKSDDASTTKAAPTTAQAAPAIPTAAPTTAPAEVQDDRMSKLKLTTDQKTKLDAANQAHETSVAGVKKNGSLSAERKEVLIEELKSKHESNVQGFLNEDQYERWLSIFRKESMGRREKDN